MLRTVPQVGVPQYGLFKDNLRDVLRKVSYSDKVVRLRILEYA